jgi:hypothetical protein
MGRAVCLRVEVDLIGKRYGVSKDVSRCAQEISSTGVIRPSVRKAAGEPFPLLAIALAAPLLWRLREDLILLKSLQH